VEFRKEEWLCKEVFDVLRNHDAALCIHDMMNGHPREVTADWVYLRYHGADTWGEYSQEQLEGQAEEVRGYLDRGLDVYAYYNNDAEGYSVSNALDLRRLVTGESG
jgi:uncharacterized protein YecE (DUF72 family)